MREPGPTPPRTEYETLAQVVAAAPRKEASTYNGPSRGVTLGFRNYVGGLLEDPHDPL